MRNCYNNVRGAKEANTRGVSNTEISTWKKPLPPLGLSDRVRDGDKEAQESVSPVETNITLEISGRYLPTQREASW